MMTLYCWGSTVNGSTGLGDVVDENIVSPQKLDWDYAPMVQYVASGPTHSMFVADGKVYGCGCNDFGQLGHELNRKRPQLVEKFGEHVITRVCCGSSHSCAISEWGSLYIWGSNSFGQLGNEDLLTNERKPKLSKKLGMKTIVQVSCGEHHNLALTNDGEIWAWGLNNYGQLGIGIPTKKVADPTRIASLDGLPIAYIACGGYHSFALSKSGAIYGWGKNTHGQLGLGDNMHRNYPTQLKTLRRSGVRKVCAGEDFSVFLTAEGGVFSCGSSDFNQTGHGIKNSISVPRMVVEMMGTQVTQIACGSRHTLAFVPSRGRVYGFGLNSNGQLGSHATDVSEPFVISGPWTCDIDDNTKTDKVFIKRIFAGGDRSFALTSERNNSIDCRVLEPNTQIDIITMDLVKRCIPLSPDESLDLNLMTACETVFNSLSCFNASFLLTNYAHMWCTLSNPGVNMDEAKAAFELIEQIQNNSLKAVIWDGFTSHMFKSMSTSPPDIETLRVYLVLPFYHEFRDYTKCVSLHTPFARAALSLNEAAQNVLLHWWGDESTEYFKLLIEHFKGVVMFIIGRLFDQKSNVNPQEMPLIAYEENLETALEMLKRLFDINTTYRSNRVPYEAFYCPDLVGMINFQQEYFSWVQSRQSSAFFLCNYPFIFDARAKTILLQTDQALQMHKAMFAAQQTNILASLLANRPLEDNEWVINVTRENIVNDTLREINHCNIKDFKKPMKVKFFGEEAEDAGGVRKEFFLLLMKEILDKKYGMFEEDEESRLSWFAPHSFEDPEMFRLVGTICGLAIYNFIIINLPFPLALYKKLLKEEVVLSDITELSPVTGRTLQNLLDYEGDDMEELFNLTFEIDREYYGKLETIPLMENGHNIFVNQENKKEFVRLYIDFVFNKSVATAFSQFEKGFMDVCGGPIMELFRANELMALVIGNEDYDWMEFEQTAKYKSGYTARDPTVRLFWEVFHELSLEDKKKFLLFLTGSDRIAIGTKSLQIILQPASDDRYLPVAHTCFNLLDLPRYQTKEKLKYKLLQAIQQYQGFNLV